MFDPAMSSRLTEVCRDVFADHVEQLFFAQRAAGGHPVVEVPYLGHLYHMDAWNDVAFWRQRVADALCARQWFAWQAPAWAGGLPIKLKDIETMEACNENSRCKIVGLFGRSVHGQSFNWREHPPFGTYCSGLMAYDACPEDLREDPELLAEFPPRVLAGLADGQLGWRPREQIARDRVLYAWNQEMGARYDAGIKIQPYDEWCAQQLPMFVGPCL